MSQRRKDLLARKQLAAGNEDNKNLSVIEIVMLCFVAYLVLSAIALELMR